MNGEQLKELLDAVSEKSRKDTAMEFAEKLKAKLFDLGNVVNESDIDEILKEMINEQ